MIQFPIYELCIRVSLLSHMQHTLDFVMGNDLFPEIKNKEYRAHDSNLLQEELQYYHEFFSKFKISVDNLKLKSSSDTIEQIIYRLKYTTLLGLKESIINLRGIVYKELNEQIYLCLPKDDIEWFNNSDGFGIEVTNAFPSASHDIKEAGNCYVIGRYTACVFHLMRVLEHGLSALAKDVRLTFYRQSWGTIIKKTKEAIDSEIKMLTSQQKDRAKTERLEFLSKAAQEFTYFKDGWRNYVMHSGDKYDEPQALSIFNHVKLFMVHLSIRLSE